MCICQLIMYSSTQYICCNIIVHYAFTMNLQNIGFYINVNLYVKHPIQGAKFSSCYRQNLLIHLKAFYILSNWYCLNLPWNLYCKLYSMNPILSELNHLRLVVHIRANVRLICFNTHPQIIGQCKPLMLNKRLFHCTKFSA